VSKRLILHEDPISGNCYKIRLTAALVGKSIELRSYDIMKRETRTPEFLRRISPNGRIPVLQIGDRFLPESNAACFWLARDSALIPSDPFDQADMLRWMFWEQYNHEPTVATLRYWVAILGEGALTDAQKAQMPGKRIAGADALWLMDDHLSRHSWFVGDAVTLADIALYAYTHVAGEGGFHLSDHPHIARWLDQVEHVPGYIRMSA
jgi:glutathione S-transferase